MFVSVVCRCSVRLFILLGQASVPSLGWGGATAMYVCVHGCWVVVGGQEKKKASRCIKGIVHSNSPIVSLLCVSLVVLLYIGSVCSGCAAGGAPRRLILFVLVVVANSFVSFFSNSALSL